MKLRPLLNYCNLCRSWSRFKHFGVMNRPQALCPKCKSLERHRLQWHYITNETNITEDKTMKILHVAPEKILFNKISALNSQGYIGIDLNPNKRELSGKILKQSVTSLRFKDKIFDFTIANHVFEHIPDDLKAMEELYRVTKLGGMGLFDTPVDYERRETYEDLSITDPVEREKKFGQYDHVRVYGLDFFKKLEKAGFQTKVIPYYKSINPFFRWITAINSTPLIVTIKK